MWPNCRFDMYILYKCGLCSLALVSKFIIYQEQHLPAIAINLCAIQVDCSVVVQSKFYASRRKTTSCGLILGPLSPKRPTLSTKGDERYVNLHEAGAGVDCKMFMWISNESEMNGG